jgi:hypothetical protein
MAIDPLHPGSTAIVHRASTWSTPCSHHAVRNIPRPALTRVPHPTPFPLPCAALHVACANGHEEVVRRLLEGGADVDVKNAEGSTPLHWACLNGHVAVVRLLMDKKASPSSLNKWVGWMPLPLMGLTVRVQH